MPGSEVIVVVALLLVVVVAVVVILVVVALAYLVSRCVVPLSRLPCARIIIDTLYLYCVLLLLPSSCCCCSWDCLGLLWLRREIGRPAIKRTFLVNKPILIQTVCRNVTKLVCTDFLKSSDRADQYNANSFCGTDPIPPELP